MTSLNYMSEVARFWITAKQALLEVDVRLANGRLPQDHQITINESVFSELAEYAKRVRDASAVNGTDPIEVLGSMGIDPLLASTYWQLGMFELTKLEKMERDQA